MVIKLGLDINLENAFIWKEVQIYKIKANKDNLNDAVIDLIKFGLLYYKEKKR